MKKLIAIMLALVMVLGLFAACSKAPAEETKTEEIPMLPSQGGDSAATETSATITFDDKSKRTEYTTSKQVWEENGIVVTNNKGSSTSNVGDYAKPARFYKNSELIVAAPGNITKIVMSCVSGYASVPGATMAGTEGTITLDGTASSYTLTLSGGQVRMNSLTVYYTVAAEEECTAHAADSYNVTYATHQALCDSCEKAYGDVAPHDADGENGACSVCGYLADLSTEEGILAAMGDLAADEVIENVTLTGPIASLTGGYSPYYGNASLAITVGDNTTVTAKYASWNAVELNHTAI